LKAFVERQTLLWTALPLLLLALSLACGGDGAPADEGSVPTASVDLEETAAPASTPEYSSVTGRLPDTFPSRFPVYDGVSIERGDTLTDSFVVDFRSADPPDDIAAFYREALDSDPWHIIKIEEAEGNITIIEFEGDDDPAYSGRIAIAPLADVTRIMVGLEVLP
jgi:hypothetical protein